MIEILQYVKHAFDDESALDSLPLEAAGNSGAWKAWRAFRKSVDDVIEATSAEHCTKQSDEWNWDGVWNERVRRGIDASVSESVLYGGSVSAEDDLVSSKQCEKTEKAHFTL